ncbi:VWA domain-containing protein [Candidatus Woesearchaeota archaeon]|nr:VWA domain-containing protein [Candidatus Woesearchaeota archaeon]
MVSLNSIANYFENPLMLLWIIPVLLFVFLLLHLTFVRSHPDHLPLLRRRRRTILLTRSIILLCIILALASPFVLRERLVKGDYSLTLLADNSTSFQVFDTQTAERLEERLSDYIKVHKQVIGDESKTPLSDSLLEQLQEGKNLLLVTDGYNNVGPELQSVVLQATKVNASIHALLLPPQQHDASIIVTGPDKVSAGIKNLFTVYVRGTGAKEAKHVLVDIDGKKIIDVYTSDRELSFSQTFSEGAHRITALLNEQGYFSENNKYYKTVKVIPKPSVLFVTQQESPLLPLLQQLYDVKVVSNLQNLDKNRFYAAVIDNIPFGALELDLPLLKNYLSDDNGVLFIGGEASFDKGDYKGTKLEELLPAFVAVAEEKEEGMVNIVIATDLSRSSVETSYGQGYYAQVQKAIALSVIENIRDSSQVGFVGFVDKPYIISEISPLGDKRDDLMQKIRSLDPQYGNSYIPIGLEAAIKMLEGVSGGKNIIFISDGRSAGIGYGKSLAAAAQEQGIKIYGVGVGDRNACIRFNARGDCIVQPSEMYGPDAIKSIALAGGGAYFTGEKTPQKVKVLFGGGEKDNDKDTYTATVLDEGHFITQNLELSAHVTGFNNVIPKSTASHLVATDSGEPLLTVWRYGVGRVGILATDDGSAWGGELLDGENSLLYTRTLNWLIGDPERKSEYYVSVQDTNIKRSTEVKVKAQQQPIAEGLTFYKRDDQLYAAMLTPTQLGFQSILGTEFAVNYNKELEGIGFNSELEEITKATGGQLFSEDQIAEIIAAVKTQAERPVFKRWYYRWPFILLALLVFLFEIYLRRAGRQ